MNDLKTGRCGCGAIEFKVIAPSTYGACHCEMCRRWCGGVWMGVVCDEVMEVKGEISYWQSSKVASRGFCNKCGSSIWHKPKHSQKYTFGQGLFDDQENWQLSREIFAEQRPSHYALTDKGQRAFTGWATLWAIILGRLPR